MNGSHRLVRPAIVAATSAALIAAVMLGCDGNDQAAKPAPQPSVSPFKDVGHEEGKLALIDAPDGHQYLVYRADSKAYGTYATGAAMLHAVGCRTCSQSVE